MTDQSAQLIQGLADRYTIDRELGSGGMATVYLAEDLKDRRKVTVKELRFEVSLGTLYYLSHELACAEREPEPTR